MTNLPPLNAIKPGSIDGTELRAIRFIDDPGSLIHGQFGVETVLSATKKGESLTSIKYQRVRVQDLGFTVLETFECRR